MEFVQVIPGGVKHDMSSQSLHPFQTITFIINHFGSTRESFYSWFSAPIVVIHCFRFLLYSIVVDLSHMSSLN
jgi:hypothetical protein